MKFSRAPTSPGLAPAAGEKVKHAQGVHLRVPEGNPASTWLRLEESDNNVAITSFACLKQKARR